MHKIPALTDRQKRYVELQTQRTRIISDIDSYFAKGVYSLVDELDEHLDEIESELDVLAKELRIL